MEGVVGVYTTDAILEVDWYYYYSRLESDITRAFFGIEKNGAVVGVEVVEAPRF